MMGEQAKNRLLIFIIAIFALEAILFSAGNFKLNQKINLENAQIEKIQSALTNIPVLAKAVSVYDITLNKKIYGLNDETAMPMASLAKTMTVLVSINKNNMNDIVTILPEAVSQAGDFGIFAYERWNTTDLAWFTLLVSANDGAYALALKTDDFLEKMNAKAKRLGLEHTAFLNPTGLDILDTKTGLPTMAGAFTSALDANLLASYAIRAYPKIFNITTMPEINLRSESGFYHKFKNTNTIVEKIPNIIFSKTGFTDLSGGNLTVIFKDKMNHLVAVTVLGSTFEGRFTDMKNIVNVLYGL